MKKRNRPIRLSAPVFGLPERRAAVRVLRSGSVVQGEQVSYFEEEFAQALSSCEAVAVNSGTSALHLGLLAMGVGPGDEVVVPSFTFVATANAVAMTGATPIFADVRLDDFCLLPASVEAAVSSKTVAIIAVHLFGHPAPMNELIRIANRHGLALVEDAAQAHGASLFGEQVGSLTAFAAFSFYPSKNMSSLEGGMVLTRDVSLSRLVRLLRNQGMASRYQYEVVGLNNRMTEVSAAIARVQLRRLARWNEQRISNAAYLSKQLQQIDGILCPATRSGARHVFNQFTLRVVEGRDRFKSYLSEKFGVQSGVYYPAGCHTSPPFARNPLRVSLDHTSLLAEQVLSIPVHPRLGQRDLTRVATAVRSASEFLRN